MNKVASDYHELYESLMHRAFRGRILILVQKWKSWSDVPDGTAFLCTRHRLYRRDYEDEC